MADSPSGHRVHSPSGSSVESSTGAPQQRQPIEQLMAELIDRAEEVIDALGATLIKGRKARVERYHPRSSVAK